MGKIPAGRRMLNEPDASGTQDVGWEIMGTLREMNFLSVNGEGYIPTYTRTDLTNHLHGSTGFRTDYQIVTKKQMRSIIALTTKKRDNDNKDE